MLSKKSINANKIIKIIQNPNPAAKSQFGIMVTVVFQNNFRLEMHENIYIYIIFF